MIRTIYKLVLRQPKYRGRHRLDNALRGFLRPPVDRVAGFRMELDPLEWNQIDLLSGNLPEARTLKLFQQLLKPGDVCVDVGAHVGLHALVAAQAVGPKGRVLAVDPQAYNADRILTNAELNGLSNILVIVAAAGEADGFVVLKNQKRNDKTRLTLAGDGVSDVATRFEVPILKLDTLAARHKLSRVSVLKIDVEGYERQVLGGAGGFLDITDNVIFESLPGTDPDAAAAIADLLIAKGFELRQIDGSPWAPGQPAIEYNVWAAKPG